MKVKNEKNLVDAEPSSVELDEPLPNVAVGRT